MIYYRIKKTKDGYDVTSKSYPEMQLSGPDKLTVLRQFIKLTKK